MNCPADLSLWREMPLTGDTGFVPILARKCNPCWWSSFSWCFLSHKYTQIAPFSIAQSFVHSKKTRCLLLNAFDCCLSFVRVLIMGYKYYNVFNSKIFYWRAVVELCKVDCGTSVGQYSVRARTDTLIVVRQRCTQSGHAAAGWWHRVGRLVHCSIVCSID